MGVSFKCEAGGWINSNTTIVTTKLQQQFLCSPHIERIRPPSVMTSPAGTFSDSSSDDAGPVVEAGVPAPGAAPSTQSSMKSVEAIPWYQRRWVYALSFLIVFVGIAGVVVAILLVTDVFGGGSDAGDSGSSSATTGVIDATSSPSEGPTLSPSSPPTLRPSARPTAAPVAITVPPTPFPTPQPTEDTGIDAFSFYLMGDVPYAEWEEAVLIDQMSYMNATRPTASTFVVHVGDLMKSARTRCTAPYFSRVAQILLQGPLPTFVMQGDNDSQDCPDPESADIHFHRYFVSNLATGAAFEDRWAQRLPTDVEQLNVTRWDDKHRDLFSFVNNGILFVSVRILRIRPNGNAGGIRDKWDARVPDSIEWFTANLNRALSAGQLRGVVIFGHASRNEETRPFFEGIVPLFVPARSFMPVLYLHGDGHEWLVDSKFAEQTAWQGFVDVQIEQGALADPVLVEVAPVLNDAMVPFQKETGAQFVFGDGLFRLDRQRGSY